MSQDEQYLDLLAIFHYVLGVFTIILLMKDSVKTLFAASADPFRFGQQGTSF